ncbi:MAG: class I SAM-dependent methyltransferase [Chloroflexia bacterium]|nr:class I SAM-dependent methyltransferase [Chloroflexia bacterium]
MREKEIVRRGYDRISRAYRGDEESENCAAYHAWLDELLPCLQPGAAILELGCGNGIPVARRLASRYAYTGVDLSPVQVERARQLVPEGTFLCTDMAELDCDTGSLDAILSFYTIIHLPLEEQPGLFRRMYHWLRPGGCLLATVGHEAWSGTEQDWLGVPGGMMYWSHADQATYERWLGEAGFVILWTRFIPEGDGGHTLVLAKKPEHQV